MSEVNNILSLLESSLRAEHMRGQATANNIANLETPGYRTLGVKFEEMLSKALEGGGSAGAGEIKPEVFAACETPVKENGNDVVLEREIGDMVKNTLRQKTYLRILSKKYSQLELAMNTRS